MLKSSQATISVNLERECNVSEMWTEYGSRTLDFCYKLTQLMAQESFINIKVHINEI
jgi:hypothetical protein